MKKVTYFIIVMFIVIITLCGCNRFAYSEKDNLNTGSDKTVPVSVFSELPLNLETAAWCNAGNSCLFFYNTMKWNDESESKLDENNFYKWEMGSDLPVLLNTKTDKEQTIQCVFTDTKDNTYFYGYMIKDGDLLFFLEKYDSKGKQIWHAFLASDAVYDLEGNYISGGVADGKGRICLYDYLGKIYFFDEQGKYIQYLDSQVNDGKKIGSNEIKLVCTKKGDLYGYYFERVEGTRDECLKMFFVDTEDITIGEKRPYVTERNFAVDKIFTGRGNTLVYATPDALWEINVKTGDIQKFLELDGEYVNIDGRQILAVDLSDQRKTVLYLYDSFDKISECAEVTKQPDELFPAKEVIRVGVTEETKGENLNYFVRRFNRKSDRWKVEVEDYFSYTGKYENVIDEFTLDILNGNAPDIMDAQSIPLKLLEEKGLFENLEPYFERSQKVKSEDLLESVWRAGQLNDTMTFVMPWFMLEIMAIQKDILDDRPWNLQTLIDLLDENPETDMISFWSGSVRTQLLNFVLEGNNDLFYNDQKKECYFIEQEFLSLLEGIKRVKESENEKRLTSSQDEISRFTEGEVIVLNSNLARISEFHNMNELFGNTVEWVGRPSLQEDCFLFRTFLMFGINSQSDKKDGAWAFLEYLLSEESQKWTEQEKISFPARKDAFDYYISESSLIDIDDDSSLTLEKEKDLIRLMVDNAYLKPSQVFSPVIRIITEESQAYFTGDRSVEETAKIIQNRVMLFYNE